MRHKARKQGEETVSEYDRHPVAPKSLKPGRYFAASYAGEHVAGTEFVIGALFVSWGVGAVEVIKGLAVGNLLAVLTWAIICAPIATDTRLTLYAYLEKIAGPSFIKIFSVINGVLFCVLGGAMITVSASAVRILFGIPAQVEWYPTSFAFVMVAIAVGGFVSYAAAKGFTFVARFAEISAPWLISIFLVGALATLPVIVASSSAVTGLGGIGDFLTLAESDIWIDQNTEMNIWHVAAIAWGANLAFHGALGDMTILRFARRTSYGLYSAIGMFIGHFAAWLAAGVMGAGAALLAGAALTSLDAGEVAFQALGATGVVAVIIAGWTTSNPTIYRAGLAFQSLNPKWPRERVTLIVGVTTTFIAIFPFVFTGLLNFLGLMALVLAPTGGVIVAEHYGLKRLGMVRYWTKAKGKNLNVPAVLTWGLSLGLAAWLHFAEGLHVLFLFAPAWLFALLLYTFLAAVMGAATADRAAAQQLEEIETRRKAAEKYALANAETFSPPPLSTGRKFLLAVAVAALFASVVLGVMAYQGLDFGAFKLWLLIATGVYFTAAVLIVLTKGPLAENGS